MSIQDEIPRSRINLRYRTEVDGVAQLLELPFRIMVMGDLSCGSATDRETDLDSRRVRSLDGKNLDGVMENMRMSLNFRVENHIDQRGDEQMEVSLPIRNRRSFNPDQVAENVPKIRGLMMLRKLLLEMQSNIDNRKELRRLIQDIWSSEESLQALRQELASFQEYKLPAGTQKPAPPSP